MRGKFADVIKAYLKIIDENSDGTLSSEEIQVKNSADIYYLSGSDSGAAPQKFVGKLVGFAFAIQFLWIFVVKEAALAVLLPAVRIGLDMKTQVGILPHFPLSMLL